MTVHPPILRGSSSRRPASGRRAALVLAAGCLAACSSPVPPPVSRLPSGAPSSSPPSVEGLLVASGATFQATDSSGDLHPVAGPIGAVIVGVTAGSGAIVVLDDRFGAWHAPNASDGRPDWQRLSIPTDGSGDRPLLALSPAGDRIAIARESVPGQTFDLVVVGLPSGDSRATAVDHQLNGPPIWLDPTTVAIDAIGPNQQSGFVAIDLESHAVADLPTFGVALAASMDGSRVAIDESASGNVFVGARADLTADGLARMTRIVGPPATGPESLALDGAGARLAIVRRTTSGATIQMVVLSDGVWTAVPTLQVAGDGPISVAWLR